MNDTPNIRRTDTSLPLASSASSTESVAAEPAANEHERVEEAANSEDPGREALLWIRENWPSDRFVTWVLDHHPMADYPPGYALTADDARFAHECATHVLARNYVNYLHDFDAIDRRIQETAANADLSPLKRSTKIESLRERRASYVALFSSLQNLQSAIESGDVTVKLTHSPLASGAFASSVGGGATSFWLDRRHERASYSWQTGAWQVTVGVPFTFWTERDRARVLASRTESPR
ncbi:MAG: hypothetical protein U1F36_09215 [Planctomycetota bacterium]